tara:strand:- start:32 stop:268 length:237 start_codon:yes stop_codon:yes gene_type:complete
MAAKKDITEGLKAGTKSSEFYMSLGAVLLGVIISTGIASPEGVGTWDKVVGVLCTLLAAFGYTTGRSQVKQAHEENKK